MAKGKYVKWLKPNNILILKEWANKGLTDKDIAHNIGISCSTLYEWKNAYPDIAEALAQEKEVADKVAENSLYKRVTGYDYEEVEEKYVGSELVSRKVFKKHLPPEVGAIQMWLGNRDPENWKGKIGVDLKHSGAIATIVNVSDDWGDDERKPDGN